MKLIMERKNRQLELTPFEELLDRQYGKPGTPKRDAFEREVDELRAKMESNSEGYPTEIPCQDELAKELQERLVQTCLDFIKEKGDKFIYRIAFSADSLQESAEEGKWMPCTDSSLVLEGLVWDPELKTVVTKEIGSYI